MKIKDYILALLMTLAIVGYIASIETNASIDNKLDQLNDKAEALSTKMTELEIIDSEQNKDIESLKTEVRQLTDRIDKTSRSGERSTKRIMEVTAYWEGSCGKLPDHPEYGITASGERVKEWHTIAAGLELAIGTRVFIPFFRNMPNGGIFVVKDRGSMIKNGCLDIYMSTCEDCMEFGRRMLEVYVLE